MVYLIMKQLSMHHLQSAKTVSLGGGFSTSSSYLVEISNNDNLPSGIYLSGSGTVEN